MVKVCIPNIQLTVIVTEPHHAYVCDDDVLCPDTKIHRLAADGPVQPALAKIYIPWVILISVPKAIKKIFNIQPGIILVVLHQ